ncbi:MAG: proprotein convertase P-domain-containing protein [Lewinellaceae bacterium]|nr:proprotein convertase P-domain-containing protein [Lewinellaceae bacterium]
MPDGFTGSFYLNVQNACNPTLGQNGQAVCGVRLHLEHEYIGDLRITLTSPGGQTITLVGPVGLFGETDGADWDVTFVPCTSPAAPDPGFANTWHNDQDWALNGTYTGDYYPASGCLNTLTGPVNGQWTMTVFDQQLIDVGTFFDYEIIFCDPSCINCFTCAANAGQLQQADVTACAGSASLNLNLPPTYTTQSPPPAAGEYDYTYVISRNPGGIIVGYDADANLSTFAAGSYTVCGMSYFNGSEPLFPAPNGSLTTAQLLAQLNSSAPPFCGRVNSNCVNVTIGPAPQNIVVNQELCAPQCTTFYGTTYCNTGVYVRNLTQNGCPYTATLVLNVNPAITINIRDTICEGACSIEPGFPNACAQGVFTRTIAASGPGQCDTTIRLTVIQLITNVVIPPPQQLTCTQTTVTLTSTGSSAGTYQWTASNGGQIVGSTTGTSAVVNEPGTYKLKVCRTNPSGAACCDSATVVVTEVVSNITPPSSINGPDIICVGTNTTYSTPALPGATSYTWTFPPGVIATSGANTNSINVTWNNVTGGNVCVRANFPCGPSTLFCMPVTTNPPVTATQPQGNIVVCAGSSTTYSIPEVNNAISYNWTVNGGTVSSGQGTNSITVLWGAGSSGSVCVSVVGPCGASPNVCRIITITSILGTPVVSGNSVACSGGTGTYSIPDIPGATGYGWVVPGGTITSHNGPTSIQVTWDAGATSGSVCASVNNSCGTSSQNCLNVTLNAPPAQPVISGDATLCSGTNGNYSFPAIPNTTGYQWTVTGGTIVSGQNTTSLVVNWGAGTGGTVCASALSSCGAGPQACFPVVVNALPNANAGSTASTCALTINLQAVNSVTGSTGAWTTVTGPGTANFANAGSPSSSVTVSQPGAYTFRWTESNGACTDDATVVINFNPNPTTGPVTILCEGTNQNFTVSFPISGGTAPYNIPGGTVTNGIFTSNFILSGQSYSFVVTDANGCLSPAVTGSFSCNCTSEAGQMSLQTVTACQGGTVTTQHLGGQFLDLNDVSSYVLHTNSGTSLGLVLAQNTTGTFGFQPGMTYGTTYYVSFVVGNNLNGFPDPSDFCLSVSPGQPVIFYQTPVPAAGADAEICGLSIQLNGNSGNGTWSVSNTPAGGTITFVNIQSNTSQITASAYGAYTLVWTLNNNGCTATDQVVVTFNASPVAGTVTHTCDPANENYTVTIPISGGEAPYSVNGVAIVGNNFVSAPIVSGQSYSFSITDANGCPAPVLNGGFNCDCTSEAGQMTLTPLAACEGASITAAHLGGQTLDGNDVSAYVLHTNAGASLGTVIAQNATGTFSFQAGMTYGTTYYVSFVVGNNLNGFPNPSDFCLSVSPGQPVVFHQNPTPDAGTDTEICGLSIQLSGNTGSGTWSVSNAPVGGTITFEDNQSDTSEITASGYGAYTLVWTLDNNGCTVTDQVLITFNASPIAGTVIHTCDPANENYTVTIPISGGEAPYSVNGTAIVGSSFVSASIPSGQNYTFTITDANGCQAPVLNGAFNCDCTSEAGQMTLTPLAACEGASITAMHQGGQTLDGNDVSAYVLHTNAGASLGTVIAQNATGTFSFQAGMTYGTTYFVSFVVGNNLNGFPDPADLCLSVAQGQPVVFHQNPTPDAGAGDATCGLTIQLSGNAGTGTWSVSNAPAGGTITFADIQSNTSEITASDYGDYTLVWTLDNNGCTVSDQVVIIFNDAPIAGTVTHTCDSANENYTVTVPISGGGEPYLVNGTAIVGNIFVSLPIPNGQNYTFSISNSNGCQAPVLNGSFNCDCTSAAGQMELTPLAACEGLSITATHLGGQTLDGNDVSAYVLHTNAGASLGTVIAQNATGTFSFQPGMTYGTTYYVSFVVGNNLNGFPNPADPCLSVAQGQPVVFYQNPVANAGVDNAVCGSIITLAGSGAGNGQWTLNGNPPGGNLVINDPQSPTTSVTASLPGQYTVVWTLEQNTCTSTDEVILTFNSNPNLSDLVRTCDPANENYTVSITIAGGTPPYLLNNTAIADSVFISVPITNNATYQYTITDANSCTMPVINGSFSCNCATDAGSMSASTLTACDGTTVTAEANNDANLDGNDVTSFVLHNGSGQSLGVIYAQNTTGVFGIQTGMNFGVTYYISRVVGNPANGFPNPLDPCFSVAPGQPVIFLEIPTPNAGVDTEICGQSFDLQALTSGFGGTWTQTSGAGAATFVAVADAGSSVSVPGFGVYTFQWEEENGICSASDEVQITFNELPAVNGLIETCNGTNTQYTVIFSVTGGTAPYSATGIAGTFTGSDFTSILLPNNSAYSFTVADANGCESPDIGGIKNCNCQTDAGTMVTTPLAFCADQPAVAPWNNDANLDADDILLFILHSQSGSIAGNVFATSDQPSFTYGAGLATGVTYYISAIAGNNVSGAIQLSDPCLSVALGTPVQWRPLPTAAMSGDATICEGSSTPLTFSGTGTFPLTVTYSTGSGANNTVTIANQQELIVDVSPPATETYTLISVASGNNPVCTTDLNESVTITINQALSAGTPNDPVAFCVGTDLPVQLSNLLTDADPGGQWTEISTVPALPGGFNAQTGTFFTNGQPAGTYRFRYTRNSPAPCPSDEAVVEIVMNPLPVADAGEDQALNCNQTTTILGGPGTSSGAAITYIWELNGANTADTKTLLTSEPGTYVLVVTNGFSCSASDAATVTLDNELPVADLITVKDVRCWGDKSGSISVDAYTTTHPPVLFSMNGGPFTNQTVYTALVPGEYTLTLQDANGCEWTSEIMVVREPPQLLLELGANITVAQGDSVHLEGLINVPFTFLDTLYWNPVMDTAKAGTLVQDFLPLVSSYFELQVIDTNGCATSDRTLIVVDQERRVYIPNIIKVGSAENDVLTVFGGRDVAEVELFRVFDRWGDQMFEERNFLPNDVTKGWKGRYKEKDVNPGVFIYTAVVRFIDGERILFKGDVTVFK